MHYFFKKLIEFPYSVRVLFSISGWGFFCAAFGYFLILSQADFEATGTKTIFMITFPLYFAIVGLLGNIENGILRLFGIKREKKELRVLNDNIKNKHIPSNLSAKILKDIFYSLVERSRNWSKVEYGGIVLFLTLLTEWLTSGATINLFIIFISGLISIFLLAMFSTFFAEHFVYPTLMECRALLAKRGIAVKESYTEFNSIRSKFTFALLIPIMVVLVISGFIGSPDLGIVIFTLIGLGMAIVISRVIFFSIYQAFLGIRNFARELPKGHKVLFSTGSLDREIVDLSESLNSAANEVYTARNELEKIKAALEEEVKQRTKELEELNKSLEGKVKERTKELRERTKELRERVNELEEFHEVTVGRELKMMELKNQIEELKKKNKKTI